MKTKEELLALKNEVEAMNEKLSQLTEEEMLKITGGETQVITDDEAGLKICIRTNAIAGAQFYTIALMKANKADAVRNILAASEHNDAWTVASRFYIAMGGTEA